jgi:hypothetical protein
MNNVTIRYITQQPVCYVWIPISRSHKLALTSRRSRHSKVAEILCSRRFRTPVIQLRTMAANKASMLRPSLRAGFRRVVQPELPRPGGRRGYASLQERIGQSNVRPW